MPPNCIWMRHQYRFGIQMPERRLISTQNGVQKLILFYSYGKLKDICESWLWSVEVRAPRQICLEVKVVDTWISVDNEH